MKTMLKHAILFLTCFAFSYMTGCSPETDTTDYNKPFNGTERRNEDFRKASIESIRQDRADERARQSGR